jgi:hypothetical protein
LEDVEGASCDEGEDLSGGSYPTFTTLLDLQGLLSEAMGDDPTDPSELTDLEEAKDEDKDPFKDTPQGSKINDWLALKKSLKYVAALVQHAKNNPGSISSVL